MSELWMSRRGRRVVANRRACRWSGERNIGITVEAESESPVCVLLFRRKVVASAQDSSYGTARHGKAQWEPCDDAVSPARGNLPLLRSISRSLLTLSAPDQSLDYSRTRSGAGSVDARSSAWDEFRIRMHQTMDLRRNSPPSSPELRLQYLTIAPRCPWQVPGRSRHIQQTHRAIFRPFRRKSRPQTGRRSAVRVDRVTKGSSRLSPRVGCGVQLRVGQSPSDQSPRFDRADVGL